MTLLAEMNYDNILKLQNKDKMKCLKGALNIIRIYWPQSRRSNPKARARIHSLVRVAKRLKQDLGL